MSTLGYKSGKTGKDLILIGGGGHAKSVLDAAVRMSTFDKFYVIDPGIRTGNRLLGVSDIFHDDAMISQFSKESTQVIISIGIVPGNSSSLTRIRLSRKLEEAGYEFVAIIDPDAILGSRVSIDNGAFIGKRSVINADTKIGAHSIINTGVILEHEVHIGLFTHIAVGSVICGQSVVGDRTFVGAGTTVVNNICIGNDAVIGAGSLVLRDVREGEKVYGIVK